MEPMKPMEPMEPMNATPWWPGDFGRPDSQGSQNDMRYAYFGAAARLVVDDGGKVAVYDTGAHRISGFGQQQSSGRTLSFSSNDGPVELSSLKKVG